MPKNTIRITESETAVYGSNGRVKVRIRRADGDYAARVRAEILKRPTYVVEGQIPEDEEEDYILVDDEY